MHPKPRDVDRGYRGSGKLTKETAVIAAATSATNFLDLFFLTQGALPHLNSGSAIINTTSVTAYAGNPELLDYASTKGASRAAWR
jgi:NAD(P)-dependent dehydrogenase (short-subunit alcohol dehydrogenase family)